jgi:hypothetical protein
MTLCIAAYSMKDNCLVVASDFMLSVDAMSTDASAFLKAKPMWPHNRWVLLFSGVPTAHETLSRDLLGFVMDTNHALSDMMAGMEAAYRQGVTHRIEHELLATYGLDRETFVRDGRSWLGDDVFARIAYQMDEMTLESSFLLTGFGPSGDAHIIRMNDEGRVNLSTTLGFSAIGSGATLALAVLYQTYAPALGLGELIYRVCEAKFIGESALGVGERTAVLVIKPDGPSLGIDAEGCRQIRPLWDAQRWPAIPADAAVTIDRVCEPIKQRDG